MKNRRVLIMFAVVLVDMLSFSVVLPMLPYLVKSFGGTPTQYGVLVAIYPLAQLFGAPILGNLSDRYGRKPILLLSIAGTAVGFLVLATARALPILFVSRFLDGVTGGNISVAQAYISDVTDETERPQALGLIGAAFGLGFIIGPITGGLLSGISYQAPAWLGAILAAVNLVLVAVFVHESLTVEDRARLVARKRRIFDFAALRDGLTHPRVGPLLGIRTGTGLSFSIFESTFTLWALAALSLTAQANGMMLAYVGVLSVFMQAFLIGRLTKRFNEDRLLAVSIAVAGGALVLWGFVPNIAAMVLLMPALSFGLAISNTLMTSELTKAVGRDEVGGILGIQTSIMSLTRIPAPIIGAVLIDRAGVWAPGVFAGVIALALVPYAWSVLCVGPGRQGCMEDEPDAPEEAGGEA
jgi:MFS transporter, DHA1 family, tetracycline resistance protein